MGNEKGEKRGDEDGGSKVCKDQKRSQDTGTKHWDRSRV
jgi:hypothetical protein